MRVMQWLIFVLSFMLLCANMRVMYADDTGVWDLVHNDYADYVSSCKQEVALLGGDTYQEIESQLNISEKACNYEPDCLKKINVTRQFLTMLKDRAHARLTRLRNQPTHRQFGSMGRRNKVQKHLQVLNKMDEMAQKYSDFFQSRFQPTQAVIPAESPVVVNNAKKPDDTVMIALHQINEKIEDLYAQREQDKYVETIKKHATPPADTLGMSQSMQQPLQSQSVMVPAQSQMMYQPYYQQPYMGIQAPNTQTAQVAMQLQAQAMAMQQQATAMMMQAQQPQQSPVYTMPLQVAHNGTPMGLQQQNTHLSAEQPMTYQSKNQRVNKLMSSLNDLTDMGEYALQRLMQLINAEFDIVELLLANNASTVIQQAVKKRDRILDTSAPAVVDAYNIVLDLATSSNKDMEAPYYQFMVKNEQRRTPLTTRHRPKKGNPKHAFLIGMLNALEHYYLIVENMQQAFKTVKR